MAKILVTGSAGFIGYHTVKHLLESSHQVVGLDNLNNYYDVKLKKDRLKILTTYENFKNYKIDLADKAKVHELFQQENPHKVINLAAQAGVRYSIENPHSYIDSNIVGFLNILENCRKYKVAHLVYASSSSVYGLNEKLPFSTSDSTDHPLSLYAASKRSNELMAHAYSNLYKLPTTGLRFFTVYGPWGRPDMALFLFSKAIIEGEKINVFNHGNHARDFTYIDDIVQGIVNVLEKPAQPNLNFNTYEPELSSSQVCWRIYNIGSDRPIKLMNYIQILEKYLGKMAKINFQNMQKGDVVKSHADIRPMVSDFQYQVHTSIEKGIEKFVKWYKEYYS